MSRAVATVKELDGSHRLISRLAAWSVLVLMMAMMMVMPGQDASADSIYVQDQAGVLNDEVKNDIRVLNKSMESSKYKAQLLVVTVRTIPDGESIEDYSMEIAQKNRPGDGDKDTGLVYLVVTDQHQDRLEVGRGMESVIPDTLANHILEARTSYYQQGDWNGGMKAVLNGVMNAVRNGEANDGEPADDGSKSRGFPLKMVLIILSIIVLALVVLAVLYRIFRTNDDDDYSSTDYYQPRIVSDTDEVDDEDEEEYHPHYREDDEYRRRHEEDDDDDNLGSALLTAAAINAVANSHHEDDDYHDDSSSWTSSSSNDDSSSFSFDSPSFDSFDSFGGGDFGGGGASGSW